MLAQVGNAVRLRSVSVHHEAAAVDRVAVGEERLAHPQHHFGLLPPQGHREVDAGMHEEAQAIVVTERQGAEPAEMQRRHQAIVVGIVLERGRAAVPQPHRHGALADMRIDRQLLVIAAQADDRVGGGLPTLQQIIDDGAAVRSAVDVVAEKDVACGTLSSMRSADLHQPPQLVEAAVNVADSEGESGCHFLDFQNRGYWTFRTAAAGRLV